MPVQAYQYEKGFIRTDRGLLVDKGNQVVSVLHADFAGGAEGDGTHDDTEAFTLADAFAQTVGCRVFVPAGSYKLSSSVTMTSEVEFAAGASVAPASGTSLTLLANNWVRPEWWGAVAASTKATAIDETVPLMAALATGLDVRLNRGWYGHTGLLVLNAIGQSLYGSGQGREAANKGTFLYKMSGTNYSLKARQTHHVVEDLCIHGGNLGGTGLVVEAAKYSSFSRITFQEVAGTSYCLSLENAGVVNLCSFYDLDFPDAGNSSYGYIDMSNVLYSDFYNIRTGVPSGPLAINMDGSSGQCLAVNFFGAYVDGGIKITGGAGSINFYGLRGEDFNSGKQVFIDIDGSGVEDVNVYGARVLRNNNDAVGDPPVRQPLFRVRNGAKGISFDGLKIRELTTTPIIFALDGADSLTISNVSLYSNEASVGIDCTGARSDHVTVRDWYEHSGPTGSMSMKCAYLTMTNVSPPIVFTARTGSGTAEDPYIYANDVVAINCGGGITSTHLSSGALALGTGMTDSGNLGVQIQDKFMKIPTYSQSGQPTAGNNGVCMWIDEDDNKVYLIANPNGAGEKKIELT